VGAKRSNKKKTNQGEREDGGSSVGGTINRIIDIIFRHGAIEA